MTFTLTTVGDNPFAPGAYGFQYLPDQLIAGGLQLVTQNIELMQLGTVVPRGTVLGRQTNYTALGAPGTNTGNGTIGNIVPGTGIEGQSTYNIVATSPTVFAVTDPEGNSLGNATVGTAFNNAELGFTITAGGTAFVVGDSFTVSYLQTVGNFIPCVKTASDGSQTPVAILADATDSTAGPAKSGAYFMGEFNGRAITFDNSWTLADLTAALSARAIHIKFSVPAADPVNGL